MIESLIYIFESGDIWAILLKVLITALMSGLVGLICTLIGKLIAKSKTSKLKEQAKIAVEAAEQKFSNEGTKMGPQKMAYVMDYLAITFPKIKSNQYLYNIAEAAVYELNEEKRKEAAKKEFEEKYGELPETESVESSTQTEDLIEKAATIIDSSKEIISDVVVIADSVKQITTPSTVINNNTNTSISNKSKASISSF